MRCIICDRCGNIIEDPKQMRVVTCARPIRKPSCDGGVFAQYRGNDRQMNDILWEVELCGECVIELEAFMDAEPAPRPVEPDEPEEPTPEEPTDQEKPPTDGEDTGNTDDGEWQGEGSEGA